MYIVIGNTPVKVTPEEASEIHFFQEEEEYREPCLCIGDATCGKGCVKCIEEFEEEKIALVE